MTKPRTLALRLTPPSPGMTLQNLRVDPGSAGVEVTVTWRDTAPTQEDAVATDDAPASAAMDAQVWLERKLKEWRTAS